MLVGENGSPYNGQIRIGTNKIVWELLQKIKQLFKHGPVDHHLHMPAVKQNAMLMIVPIGRVLEEPLLLLDLHRNRPEILSCRMGQMPRKAHVFQAQLTLGVCCGFLIFSCGYVPGILFRL